MYFYKEQKEKDLREFEWHSPVSHNTTLILETSEYKTTTKVVNDQHYWNLFNELDVLGDKGVFKWLLLVRLDIVSPRLVILSLIKFINVIFLELRPLIKMSTSPLTRVLFRRWLVPHLLFFSSTLTPSGPVGLLRLRDSRAGHGRPRRWTPPLHPKGPGRKGGWKVRVVTCTVRLRRTLYAGRPTERHRVSSPTWTPGRPGLGHS